MNWPEYSREIRELKLRVAVLEEELRRVRFDERRRREEEALQNEPEAEV